MLPSLSSSKNNSKRYLLLFLLSALLFSQWLGFAHRMSHAGWAEGNAPVVLSQQASNATSLIDTLWPNSKDDSSTQHSCALYDAACVAEYLHLLPEQIVLLDGHALASSNTSSTGWQALLRVPFSSRAPPVLFA
ncbi:hypothetical protein ACO0K9_08265 [Undibacterium sp. Ji50W]|uniref:hypothetical protein n=1 Tax=Undibacterium sp. Ji50W TaxID=3413041 RepID=UPI003BEFB398